jgi:hypothetical protein
MAHQSNFIVDIFLKICQKTGKSQILDILLTWPRDLRYVSDCKKLYGFIIKILFHAKKFFSFLTDFINCVYRSHVYRQLKIENMYQSQQQSLESPGITERDDIDPILKCGIGDALICAFFYGGYNELQLAINIISFWQPNVFVFIFDYHFKYPDDTQMNIFCKP